MIDTEATASAPLRLIRLPDVMHLAGISKSTVYKLEGEGMFPKRVALGGRMAAWVESEVIAWVAERVAERDRLAA